MEVLLGDEPFARLVEEYMGPDARRYLDGLYDSGYNSGYIVGYNNGYADGQSR